MSNKQSHKNTGKQNNQAPRNSLTNELYNGIGSCTSCAKQPTEKNAQPKKNEPTDCSH